MAESVLSINGMRHLLPIKLIHLRFMSHSSIQIYSDVCMYVANVRVHFLISLLLCDRLKLYIPRANNAHHKLIS